YRSGKLLLTTALCSAGLFGLGAPALADITTTTTTIYSYNFPGQGTPDSQTTTTTTSGACMPVDTGGGDPSDAGWGGQVSYGDSDGDGVTDAGAPCSCPPGSDDGWGDGGQTQA